MKNVLFDLVATQPNASGLRHGGGKYGEIVFKRIVNRNLPIICFYDGNKWINPDIQKIINEKGLILLDINKVSLNEIVEKYNIRIIYSALPSHYLMSFTKCRVIGTVHGLRGLETPLDSFIWKYRNVRWKDKIKFLLKKHFPRIGYAKDLKFYGGLKQNSNFSFVTVSNHSSTAFKSYFPQYKKIEIPVFYSPSTSIDKAIERKYAEPYFMLVSGNRWEKNNLRAIMALDKLFSMGYLKEYNVRITGAKDASNYRYKIQNSHKFIFSGYVDEDELEQLYHDAYCLIYPSLNEGFGYPPLEAMHYGVPVLASPFTSIPEVCQNAALYFNPYSVEEIMGRILQIIDENNYKKHSVLALEQYSQITARQNADLDKLIDYMYGCGE